MYPTNIHEYFNISRSNPAEQLYLEQLWMFSLTKVLKLRSKVTKRINKKSVS